MQLESKVISQSAFRKFGKVVKLSDEKPTSEAADYKFWSNIADYNIDGPTEVGICYVYRQPVNDISGMERHLNTPEILIPINAPFILPLLKDGIDEEPEAFLVNVGEAVIIDVAVWHGACLPFGNEESSYFVIFKKCTPIDDVEKKDIEKFEIVF